MKFCIFVLLLIIVNLQKHFPIMKYNINVTRSQTSRVSSVDFENIPFGQIFTDHMFMADYIDGEWTNIEIKPTAPLSIHPGNVAWHYGQAIFEGMKATKHQDGTPLLLRPELHALRINASARRMCMPEFPVDLFLEALHTLVDMDSAWIPPITGSALYLRPFMIATDDAIGVKPSDTYKFMICCLPAGPYYGRPVKLKAETTYIRAAQGGVGEAKAAGNYAASLYPAKLAKEEGYDQVMWLDANEFKYIQEVGTMNIFFVIGDTVITPATEGTILKGITRDSIIHILKDNGYKVEERRLSIDEVVDAYDKGELREVFGAGTAAVVAQVSTIAYKDKVMELSAQNMKISKLAKDTINGLRDGSVEDKFGWTVPVQSPLVMA